MGIHRVYTHTGAGAISASCAIKDYIRIKQVTVHFDAAPTTPEDMEFVLNANEGSAYDTLVYSLDPSAASITDLVWIPDPGALVLINGDSFDITYTNTDANTIGIQVYYELRP